MKWALLGRKRAVKRKFDGTIEIDNSTYDITIKIRGSHMPNLKSRNKEVSNMLMTLLTSYFEVVEYIHGKIQFDKKQK